MIKNNFFSILQLGELFDYHNVGYFQSQARQENIILVLSLFYFYLQQLHGQGHAWSSGQIVL